MFFMRLRVVEMFAVAAAILAAACAIIWFVHKRRNHLRIPIIVLSSPVALLAALLIGAQVLTRGCESYSAPLYSPSHSKLIRVSTVDGGALGGSSALELLTHHGFSSTYIYRGGWNSVDVSKDVHWLDDGHVTIEYDPYQFDDCKSTKTVQVRCLEKKYPITTGMLMSPDGNAVAELHTAKDGTYQGTDAVVLTEKVGDVFVYVGDPASVVWQQTRWISDRKLQITMKGNPKACADQIGINCRLCPLHWQIIATAKNCLGLAAVSSGMLAADPRQPDLSWAICRPLVLEGTVEPDQAVFGRSAATGTRSSCLRSTCGGTRGKG